MAPKRGIQQPNTKTDSAKRPRLNPITAVAGKAIANPRRTRPRPEEYSPNIDTSDFSELTEDDDEPRSASFARLDGTVDVPEEEDVEGDPPASGAVPSGQFARKTRASRRAAETQGNDFTEDEEEEQLVVDVEAEIEEPEEEEEKVEEKEEKEAEKEAEKEEAAVGSDADAEGEVVEEQLEVQTPAKEDADVDAEEDADAGVEEDADADANAELDAKGEEVKEDPEAVVKELVAELEEAVAEADKPVEAIAKKAFALPAYYTTSDGSTTPVVETPPPASGAEARYRAFMAERLGHSGLPNFNPHQEGSLFTPPGRSGLHADAFYDPTSSSSSAADSYPSSSSFASDSSSVVEEVAPYTYASTSSTTAYPALEMVNSRDSQETLGTTDMDFLNLADQEMDIPIMAMGDDEEDDDGDGGSYIVSRRNKLADRFLSIQLRKIGRALNFIVRAKATGIDVDDFDTLASVDPEKWSELVDTPENAAEIMVEEMLQMSFWDIVILSKRATMLMDELETLGITI